MNTLLEWQKRFSAGLMLDADLIELDDFLFEYGKYIDNFYFSLPLGDRMHSRKKVADLFHESGMESHFWSELEIIKKHGIRLEALFNTHSTHVDDIEVGKQLLSEHGITPQKIGLVDEFYDVVRENFPNSQLVFSYNNFPENVKSYEAGGHHYDEYVIGRQFIRNREVFDWIHSKAKSKTVLLLNNGCSFICGGCREKAHCYKSYQRATNYHSGEYLYALQSILPYELTNSPLAEYPIDICKINSRNARLGYLRDCLKSYIFGEEQKWIDMSPSSYGMWGSLTWHKRWFSSFSLENIRSIKDAIYQGKAINDIPAGHYVDLILDLTDTEISNYSTDSLQNDIEAMGNLLHATTRGVLLSLPSNNNMDTISKEKLYSFVTYLHSQKIKIWWSVPAEFSGKHSKLISLLDTIDNKDAIIVHDQTTMDLLLKTKFANLVVYSSLLLHGMTSEQRNSIKNQKRIYNMQSGPLELRLRDHNTILTINNKDDVMFGLSYDMPFLAKPSIQKSVSALEVKKI